MMSIMQRSDNVVTSLNLKYGCKEYMRETTMKLNISGEFMEKK